MAESIFTILKNRKTLTAVKGVGEYKMELPDTMPTDEQFNTEGELYDWTMKHGITHAVLQKGIQKHLIDLRAKFRLVKKDETWNYDVAQSNVDNAEWEVITPPNAKPDLEGAKKQAALEAGGKIAQAMSLAGLDNTTIYASLEPVYGALIAQEIVDSLTK